jgi:hypothetical protein
MPIDTDHDTWQRADPLPSTRAELRDFLESNAGQAFTVEEVADAVVETDLDHQYEKDELVAELGHETFYDRLEAGEFPEFETESELADSIDRRLNTYFVMTHLSALVEEGFVEVRTLPGSLSPDPFADESASVAFYAWADR